MFVTPKQVRKQYNVAPSTLRNWARKGIIDYRTVQNGSRRTWLYDLESIGKKLSKTKKRKPRVLYARVSSQKQRNDLTRQIQLLQDRFPNDEVISDIGSGLNFKRQGFSKLVDRICQGDFSEVVVTYRDRIARFGYELFERVCKQHNVRVVVLCKLQDIEGGQEELQEDLLSIVNVFVARQNGRRAGQLRRKRKRKEAVSERNEENKDIPNRKSEEHVAEMLPVQPVGL